MDLSGLSIELKFLGIPIRIAGIGHQATLAVQFGKGKICAFEFFVEEFFLIFTGVAFNTEFFGKILRNPVR